MNINRFFSFSTQRALFSIVFCFLPISLSIGVLWNHLDSLGIFTGFYLLLTKFGLLLVEITAVFFLLWELSVKDKVLSNYCFFGNIIIVLMMLIHVGSVFQYDSGLAKLKSTQNDAINSARPLLELNNELLTKQNTELLNSVKDEKNSRNNTRALSAIVESTNQTSTKLVGDTIAKLDNINVEGKRNISTLLPISYIESGTMYIVPILISFLLGVIALFISKTSVDAAGVTEVSKKENVSYEKPTNNIAEESNTDIKDSVEFTPNHNISSDNLEEKEVEVVQDVIQQSNVDNAVLSRNALLDKMRFKE